MHKSQAWPRTAVVRTSLLPLLFRSGFQPIIPGSCLCSAVFESNVTRWLISHQPYWRGYVVVRSPVSTTD